jgi:hypothetical protein
LPAEVLNKRNDIVNKCFPWMDVVPALCMEQSLLLVVCCIAKYVGRSGTYLVS